MKDGELFSGFPPVIGSGEELGVADDGFLLPASALLTAFVGVRGGALRDADVSHAPPRARGATQVYLRHNQTPLVKTLWPKYTPRWGGLSRSIGP